LIFPSCVKAGGKNEIYEMILNIKIAILNVTLFKKIYNIDPGFYFYNWYKYYIVVKERVEIYECKQENIARPWQRT